MINKSDLRKIKRLTKRISRYKFFTILFVLISSLIIYVQLTLYQLDNTCNIFRLVLGLYNSCNSRESNFLILSTIFLIIFRKIMDIEFSYMRSGTIRKGSGNSMFPTICNGDFLKVRFFNSSKDKLKKGDIVGFKLPLSKRTLSMILRFKNPTLVKRIDRIYKEEKSVRVLGDNDSLHASWDSRHFGNIKFENIEHIVEETFSLRDHPFLDNK